MASPGTRLAAPRRTRRCPELADGQQCQKRRGVKGRQPDRPAREGIRSLEVRWIFPGQLETAVAGWFDRFPATRETREDTYFPNPHLPQLCVKIRGGEAVEVKVYRGSPGILMWRDAPAGAWSPGISGPFHVIRLAKAAVTRPGGGRCASGGGSPDASGAMAMPQDLWHRTHSPYTVC